ncbi:MAG: CapA family protein [Muribaculaceae bacterium]|nr:CapA family protein [Muribaculaceae bacterium]
MLTAWLLPLFTSLASLVLGYDEADLIFVGDAMQHKAQLEAASTRGGYDYSGYFDAIEPIVSTADLAVVNLETPVGKAPHTGYPCFNAPEAFVDALADAGFDLFLTANNHTLDRGPDGLRSTIDVLDKRGLAHLGTYTDTTARAESLPLILPVNGFRIGFLNYTYGTNGIEPRKGVAVDYIDRARIRADVDASRAAGAELVCVCIHWGDEYKLLPNTAQKHLADFLEAIGVDMIVGAHPHVIQPMELRPNRYIEGRNVLLVYSLGNFVSNMKTADTRGGAMLHVKLFRGADRVPQVKAADYRLLFTLPAGADGSNFRVLEADSVRVPAWTARAQEFARRSRNIFDKHNTGVAEAQSPR